jgi:hypothetical protein
MLEILILPPFYLGLFNKVESKLYHYQLFGPNDDPTIGHGFGSSIFEGACSNKLERH